MPSPTSAPPPTTVRAADGRSATSPASPGPRARRTQADRSAATRDALMAAARTLFAAHGFADVSTDAIVAAAGVTRGALYHQFADKMALFDAVLDAVEADIARRLAEDVAAAGDHRPGRRDAARAQDLARDLRRARDSSHRADRRAIGRRLGALARGMPAARVRAGRGHAPQQGIESGRVRPQLVRALAHVLMGASDEAALYVAESADRAHARADMLQVLDRLIDVLSAGDPTPPRLTPGLR